MYTYKATILRVVDGDTVDASVDLGFHISIEMKLRLAGINAPECKGETRDAGIAATEYLKSLLAPFPTIAIETIKDKTEKYGRYLAYLILPDGTVANSSMIAAGHAVAYMTWR